MKLYWDSDFAGDTDQMIKLQFNTIKFEELSALVDEAKSEIYFSWGTGTDKLIYEI